MFVEMGVSRPLRFTNVSARTWVGIDACTWNVVNDANFFFFVKFVFGLNKNLSERAAGLDAGAEALRVEKSNKGLSDAGKIRNAYVAQSAGRRRRRKELQITFKPPTK